LEKVGVHCEEKEEQNKKNGNSHAARGSSCSTTPACKQQWENQNQLLFEALKRLLL
jgi:hypothetical protein